jgi:hypothetical protein
LFDFLALVVGYYKQDAAKKFLSYGRLMRPIVFSEPTPMPMLSYKLRGHVYNNGKVELPVLMSGAFKSEDGELGIFIINTGGEDLTFHANVDLIRYDMPKNALVDVDTLTPEGNSQSILRNAKGIVPLKGSLVGHHITMFRLKPSP